MAVLDGHFNQEKYFFLTVFSTFSMVSNIVNDQISCSVINIHIEQEYYPIVRCGKFLVFYIWIIKTMFSINGATFHIEIDLGYVSV